MAVQRGQAMPPIDNNYKTFTKSLETTKVRQQLGMSLWKKIQPLLSRICECVAFYPRFLLQPRLR